MTKEKIITLLNGELKEKFIKELKNKYYIIDEEEISIFGLGGFDDPAVYENSLDMDLGEDTLDNILGEMEYIYNSNNNLIEVFNGEVQCIMEVSIIDNNVYIVNEEYHHTLISRAMENLGIPQE